MVPDRWLFGPARDLIFGCGLGYLGVIVAVTLAGGRLQQWLPAGLLVILVTITSAPHYGATLLRVYEQRESRRRYAVFSVWISLGLAIAFVTACYWYELGSWMLTLYLNWSPWHYAGQNYGIALMFMHRRGVVVSPTAKRLLYSSFILAFLLTILKVNGKGANIVYGAEGASKANDVAGPIYQFIPMNIPTEFQHPLMVLVFAAYVIATLGAFRLLLRSGSARDLVPSALIVASQALWFVAPTVFHKLGLFGGAVVFSPAHAQYAFLFIAAAHSSQYLWITTYYAKREPTYRTTPRYLSQTMLAGCLIWTLPGLLFAPRLLGTVAYNDGLVFLVAAVVNLHHFVLDGAVWKLRDGRVARVLLRDAGDDVGPMVSSPHHAWIRPTIWAVGLVCFAITFTSNWDREFGIRRGAAAADLERVQAAVSRLAFVGRDRATDRLQLGIVATKNDRDDIALEQFQESIALKPNSIALYEIGHIHSKRQNWPAAVKAYEAAYALAPTQKMMISRLGWALIYKGDSARAIEVLREGLQAHPGDAQLENVLEEAEKR